MKRAESSIILTHCSIDGHVLSCCRLIQTVDVYHGNDVFSVFVSTSADDETDEEFVYDISHDKETAVSFFTRICQEHISACTLLDIAQDFLAES